MLLLEKLAENKIKAALECGDLDNLSGKGKPLVLDDDSHIPAELRADIRILKNSGYVPMEVTVRKEIRHIESLLNHVETVDEKTRLVNKLSHLKIRITKV